MRIVSHDDVRRFCVDLSHGNGHIPKRLRVKLFRPPANVTVRSRITAIAVDQWRTVRHCTLMGTVDEQLIDDNTLGITMAKHAIRS